MLSWAPIVAHLSLPFLVRFGTSFFKSASEGLHIHQLQYQTRDMKDLSRYSGLVFLLTSTLHVILIGSWILPNIASESSGVQALASVDWLRLLKPLFETSFESVQVISLAAIIIAWTTFTVWDMHRVNITQAHWAFAFVSAIVGSIVFGPAAILAALWWWREDPLESGRKRLTL